MEVSCLLEAMYWVKGLNFHNVFFETDAKSVMDELNSSRSNAIEIGVLLDDCKGSLELKEVSRDKK